MGFSTPGRKEEDKIILPPETISKIVGVLVEKCPAGSQASTIIAQPYIDLGFTSTFALDRIMEELVKAGITDIEFETIGDNEDAIISAYIDRIGYPRIKSAA